MWCVIMIIGHYIALFDLYYTVGRSFFEGYIFRELRVFVCFREFYLRENWLINHY